MYPFRENLFLPGVLRIAVTAVFLLIPTLRLRGDVPQQSTTEPEIRLLSIEDSVQYALANNPQLAAIRAQHGIAAAGVVVAQTYPFNPIYQGIYQGAEGPNGSVLSPFVQQHVVTLETELFHQRDFRRQQAFAALSRTNWEIAAQEISFALNAVRAFDAVLYRQRKLAIAQQFLQLDQQGAAQVRQLVQSGTLKSGDLIVARAEVSDIQSQIVVDQTAVTSAKRDYYRALGLVDTLAEPTGTIERNAPTHDATFWLQAAADMRPDLCARMAAVREAEAAVKLQKSNRFGNPSVGPFIATNESEVTFIGAQVTMPIPVLNLHPGEIQQADAQYVQSRRTVRQTEAEIWQDVTFASTRLAEAQQLTGNYREDILPSLRQGLSDMQLLFREGQGGVDLLRVLDVRRKLLKAEDGYVDALVAYTTAMTDLAQGVGDVGVAVGEYNDNAGHHSANTGNVPAERLPTPQP